MWSPGGDRIAFASNRLAAGGDPEQGFDPWVTSGPNQEKRLADMTQKGGVPLDWSPDARFLLYHTNLSDLWIVPVEGGEQPYSYVSSRYNETAGAFSPDGHWIAYASDESGRNEIYNS